MNFRALYRHGFARVAACTIPSALADPAANAESVLRVARECHAQGAAVALFPELALSAYSIDDLRLQDALLDAVETAAARLIEESRTLMPADRGRRAAAPPRPGLQLRPGDPSRPAARRRAQSLPAQLPGVLRTSPVRRRRRLAQRRNPHRRPRRPLRPRPGLPVRGPHRPDPARRNLRGCLGPRPAQQHRCTRRRHRAAQSLRQPDHHRQGRYAPHALPIAIGPLPRRLSLRRGRRG